jgi:hypothetical protein
MPGIVSNPLRAAAWREYWLDAHSPHPDAIGPQKALQRTREPHLAESGDYCHHYRLSTEHYHHSFEDLEQCSE